MAPFGLLGGLQAAERPKGSEEQQQDQVTPPAPRTAISGKPTCPWLTGWTQGFPTWRLLSRPKLLTFKQGFGLGTPERSCPCPHTPDSTGSSFCAIFAACEKLQRSGERRKQLQLNFPIFHSERRREIFSFAHIANSPKLHQGRGFRGGQKDGATRLGSRETPGKPALESAQNPPCPHAAAAITRDAAN